MELVDVMSDMSADSEDEQHVMDPSDPRAHGRSDLRAKRKPTVEGQCASRWDSDKEEDDDDDEDEEEVDEDLGVPIQVDDEEVADQEDGADDESSDVALKLKARLSSWAASRFLVPRSERKLPVIEELPIEPLNDFILSDFGTRFRGTTGDVPVEKAVADDDAASSDSESVDKFTVGAPLFSTTSSSPLLKDVDKISTDTNDTTRNNKPRRENRYFITDLATKCFNCGQVGHMASVCANDKLERACYYCALRGHPSFACPHLPCSACLRLGHEFKDCPNRRVQRGQSCSLCGRAGHTAENGCANASAGLSQTTCMVCLQPGHLSCTPFPPPADRRVYCPHCAGNHALARCTTYVAPAATSFSARLPRTDMKCFVCNTAGHIAAECPKRTGYNGGNSCFNCGERGHYASDCTRSSRGGGKNSKNGRKRGRNEYYADDYYDEEEDEEDYRYGASRDGGGGRKQNNRNYSGGNNRYRSVAYDDEDESGAEEQYYYVPNGNNRRGGARGGGGSGGGSGGGGGYKKPRLDSALPSYRHNNNNNNGGGGGYNKGNRRRWN